VVLRGLRKVYEGASWLPCGSGSEAVIAVDSLDLTMYRGQLFCLLGQNGAGKSSVIGMLTGLFPMTVSGPNGPPRSTQLAQLNWLNSTDSTQLTQLNWLNWQEGTVTCNGHDLRTEPEAVRSSMGVCPQHDVLWDEVSENGQLLSRRGRSLPQQMPAVTTSTATR
jgi:ATP-binding cassette subfamily A (ABC1) protein 3